ncbi:uncharacterized protein LOC134983106 [Pseudophryne corroboree]|uniref:uncharacterized protein LOC134983106 n=1 Tax=Pseudophryne corroboree TaxID=495146 RepID=UPI0030820FFE
MENHRPLASLDGPSNRDTPERCPRSLYSQDCTEENHRIPQEDQIERLSDIKIADIEGEEETFVTDIKAEDIEGEETYATDIKTEDIEEEEIYMTVIKAEDIEEEETYVTDIKAEDLEGEETYVTDIKAEDLEGEETYVTDIKAEDLEGEETYVTDIKAEDIKGEEETNVTDIKAEDIEEEEPNVTDIKAEDIEGEETYVTDIKAEDIEGEETYVMIDQQSKEEEIPTDIGTGMSRDQRPRATPSPHFSEKLLDSNDEWAPTQEEEIGEQPRSSRDQGRRRKKKRPSQATSQPERQSDEEASGEDTGRKNPRGPRYTEAENCALVDGVDRSYDVLYGLRAQNTAANTKRKIWVAITDQVIAVSGNCRSTRNCMKRYSDCRRQTKKKMGIQRQHETTTGGGPPLNFKWLPWEKVIKRRMNPVMVQGVRGSVDSTRPAGFQEEEEPPRRRKMAGAQLSKKRRDDTPTRRPLPTRRTSPAPRPAPVRQISTARSTSPARRASPARDQSSRSSETVTEEPQEADITLYTVDPSPDLFESTWLTDETFSGSDDSSADASIRSQEMSPDLRPREAPGASAAQNAEEVPHTSSGLALGISPYFRPDLLQEELDDEMDVQQPAVFTTLSAQMQLVTDVQQGQDPSRVQRVSNLATEMLQRQDSFRDVINTRLGAIEKSMEKMATVMVEMQKAMAHSMAVLIETRQKDHRERLDVLHSLVTSINRLVENTACLSQSSHNMSESQRHSAASAQLIATTLQMIYDKLPESAQQHAIQPPHLPPPATLTPPGLSPPQPWNGQSHQYQGYAGMYPIYEMPLPQTPASTSTQERPLRPIQRTQQPPRTPSPPQEEEDQDSPHTQ